MSRRVLIVDDEPDILEVARMSLESVAGWEVLVATGGREATELVRTERPDAVLLDVMMPDLDGPATLALIREHSPPETLPALFLTAKAQRVRRRAPRAARGPGHDRQALRPDDPRHSDQLGARLARRLTVPLAQLSRARRPVSRACTRVRTGAPRGRAMASSRAWIEVRRSPRSK